MCFPPSPKGNINIQEILDFYFQVNLKLKFNLESNYNIHIGHRQKKNLSHFGLLLLWPGEVRRKREGDSGRTGPALFAGSNNQNWVNFFSADALLKIELDNLQNLIKLIFLLTLFVS